MRPLPDRYFLRSSRMLGRLISWLPTGAALSVVVATLVSNPAFGAGPYGTIRVGDWRGGAYTDDKTGAFTHCVAGMAFGSGVYVTFGQNTLGNWLLGFAHLNWNLNTGDTIPINVTFDGQSPLHLFGLVAQPTFVTAVLPNVDRFRKGHLMVAVMQGQTYQFNLVATAQLAATVSNCVAKTKAAGSVSGAGDFSLPPPKPPQVAVTAQPTATAQPKSPKMVDVSGTGFAVTMSGHVVTNNHVVSKCVGDIRGNLTSGNVMTLRVLSTDETNDLALLQAPTTFKDNATIRSTAIHSGDSVIAIGYPFRGLLTSDFTVTTGIVSSLSGLLNDSRYLQISAPVQPGNSGGPLLDMSGNVVGVVAEKFNALKFAKLTGGQIPENMNFAIKTGAMRDFLDNSVVAYKTAESSTELKVPDIANSARAYTMLISCTAKSE